MGFGRNCVRPERRYFSIAVARVGALLGSILRNVLTGVPSQDFIDKGLISDSAPTCFLAELIEHSWIDANRDQLARFITKRRATDPPHGFQLLSR